MKNVLCILISLFSTQLFAKELVSFTVSFEEEYIDVPISLSLDNIDYNRDSLQLQLYEITRSGQKFIPSQLESGHSARLWFVLEGVSKKIVPESLSSGWAKTNYLISRIVRFIQKMQTGI
jgi:hypothetical protein